MTTWIARCFNRSCPVRFRAGADRWCRWCQPDDGMTEAATALGIDLGEQPHFTAGDGHDDRLQEQT